MNANTEIFDCVVVGAGASGLTAASVLQQGGKRVRTVDKGRGVGGRMATRQIGEHRFDHGAQVLVGTSQELRNAISGRADNALLRPLPEFPLHSGTTVTFGPLGGVNGMSSLAKSLASGLVIEVGVRIGSVCWADGHWQLISESGRVLVARSIVLTPPVPQTVELIENSNLHLPSPIERSLRTIAYEPCLALMIIGDPAVLRLESGFVRPSSGGVELLVDNYWKGVSAVPGAITLHGLAEFSQAMFQSSDEEIASEMLRDAGGYLTAPPVTWQVHRWRYSRAVVRLADSCLITTHPGLLAFAGDGFGPGEIEGAVQSGRQAAEELLRLGL